MSQEDKEIQGKEQRKRNKAEKDKPLFYILSGPGSGGPYPVDQPDTNTRKNRGSESNQKPESDPQLWECHLFKRVLIIVVVDRMHNSAVYASLYATNQDGGSGFTNFVPCWIRI